MRSARMTSPARGHSRRVAFALLASLIGGPGASARDGVVMVQLDRAQVMPFPPTTETVVVGNPVVADVTMLHRTGQVILTGKSYGETNILFLDGQGQTLSEARLVVREGPGLLVVQRGMDRQSYACHPRCEPTLTLGDDSSVLDRMSKDITTRNSLALGAAPAPPAAR